MDWNAARRYCENLEEILGYKMDLAAIETKVENDAINAHIIQNCEFKYPYFWYIDISDTSGNLIYHIFSFKYIFSVI